MRQIKSLHIPGEETSHAFRKEELFEWPCIFWNFNSLVIRIGFLADFPHPTPPKLYRGFGRRYSNLSSHLLVIDTHIQFPYILNQLTFLSTTLLTILRQILKNFKTRRWDNSTIWSLIDSFNIKRDFCNFWIIKWWLRALATIEVVSSLTTFSVGDLGSHIISFICSPDNCRECFQLC